MNITLRVLSKPDVEQLPKIFRVGALVCCVHALGGPSSSGAGPQAALLACELADVAAQWQTA